MICPVGFHLADTSKAFRLAHRLAPAPGLPFENAQAPYLRHQPCAHRLHHVTNDKPHAGDPGSRAPPAVRLSASTLR